MLFSCSHRVSDIDKGRVSILRVCYARVLLRCDRANIGIVDKTCGKVEAFGNVRPMSLVQAISADRLIDLAHSG